MMRWKEQACFLNRGRLILDDRQQHSITVVNFPFTKIDSVIGRYRIKLFVNDVWTVIDKRKKIP